MEEHGQDAYHMWYEEHREHCPKNFDGSSGMMEVEGARVLWGHSLAKKMRYTTILSDGDSKSYTELCKLNPYGNNCPIEKAECINHVSKRLGTALRTLVSDNKKRGINLGGRGKGTLTQVAIAKLQSYYAKAIRSNTQSPQAMEDAVWATLFHCSTDEDPHHHRCPKGENSWCFYNRAEARHELPSNFKHEDNLGTYINRDIFNYLVPVYERLAHKDLLKRCMQSKTQNANECLHGVIWSRCPKETFASRSKVELATLIAVGEFNMGSSASHNFMAAQSLTVGQDTLRLGRARDSVRKMNSQRNKDAKWQQRREKIWLAKQKERKQQIEAEGGPAYVPGGF